MGNNNSPTLDQYVQYVGAEVIDQLFQLAAGLTNLSIVHVNSTRQGGGVAEILERLVPLMRELGLDASWEVIEGEPLFYDCTKAMHNALQGNVVRIPQAQLDAYLSTNERNARALRSKLEAADIVFIHDPQPAPLISFCKERKGKWFWRCHIDVSRPYRPVWTYLRQFVKLFDASIWSLATYAQPLPHVSYLIPPSIDPLSEKNILLHPAEIDAECAKYGIDRSRPVIAQISRFDNFKDPLGVIRAYQLAKPNVPLLQLVLAGGTALDDPEGDAVLRSVYDAAAEDPDIHILLLPPTAHRTINALQRAADVVIQKSLREGFGLTVTEALWKNKPVIGGDTGGIRLQVINHHTGFLVNSPEGAALRLRYLLADRERLHDLGAKGHEFVRDHFLLTRQLRDYLIAIVGILHQSEDRILLEA
jgi:trehalose synthase